jgi:hypothetical protein
MATDLTVEEQATNYQTMRHIRLVGRLLHICMEDLMRRADAHDRSKLERPEVDLFTKFTARLAASTYGSPEYEAFRKEMGPALAHHYANNSHHPEHFKNGVADMTLLDVLEMFCDWKASSLRHNDGNIRKSVEINANRFGLSPQLVKILENTAAMFDGVTEGA